VAAFPGEGFRDVARRLRIARLLIEQLRARDALAKAETELGWLGWEQVDFFELEINEEVEKVKEYENTQASLLNTSAELSGRKAALDEELARERAVHDQAQAALAAERAPIAAQFDEAETRRRQKLEAAARFERAIDEMASAEKDLEARSLSFMKIERPTLAVRTVAREISDELARLSEERKRVLADKVNALNEAARLEPELARLRADLQRIDTAADDARDRFATADRRLAGEMRILEREQTKSNVRMSHLDREKRKPYRLIGICLADHGIAPLNQPEIYEKVMAMRDREAQVTQALTALEAACAAANPGVLVAFYLLLAALFFAIPVIAWHFLHQ
jgi:chromosome segregation ATPase